MTFGEKLKGEREARGFSLDQVAAATKVALRYLAALERDDFDALPGDVFTKGFVRAIARFIGSDADGLVAEYVRQRGVPPEPAAGEGDAVVREMSRVLKVGEGTDGPRAGGPGARVLGGAAVVVLLALLWGATALRRGAREAVPAVSQVVEKTAVDPAPAPVIESAPPPTIEPAPVVESVSKPEPVPPPVAEPPAPRIEPAKSKLETKPEPKPETKPKPKEPPPARRTPKPELIVSDFGVGADVVNLDLVGRAETFRVGNDVWFWNRVLRGTPQDKIRHVWIHEGREVAATELEIGSGNWRTQSYRHLDPGSLGGWAVEARDLHGRVLARSAFVCVSR